MTDDQRRPRLTAMTRLRYDKHSAAFMLLYPERGMQLNTTATHILELCDGRKTVSEVVAALATKYQKPVVLLDVEVNTFLRSLSDRGLIEWVAE